MKFTFFAPVLGQFLTMFLATSSISLKNAGINNNMFFVLISCTYTVIFLGSLQKILIFGTEKKGEPKFWLYPITGLFDFLAGYLIAYTFGVLPAYVTIVILQMIYPMSILIECFFFKGKCRVRDLLIFLLLVAVSLYANYEASKYIQKGILSKESTKTETIQYVKAIACGLTCNLLFCLNTIIQSRFILNKVDASSFLLRFSAFGLLFGFIITIGLYSHHGIGKDIIWNVYKEKWASILAYGCSLGMFYLATSPYIKRFNPNAFNGSTVAQNAYIGLYTLFVNYNSMQLSAKYLLCVIAFVSVILTSILLVGFGFKGKAGSESDNLLDD